VEVDAQPRTPFAERRQLGRQNRIDIRIVLEDGAKPVFHGDGQSDVRTGAFEDFRRWSRKDAIAERS
jgi:hypothetical protein